MSRPWDLELKPRRPFRKGDLEDKALALKTLIVSARRGDEGFKWEDFVCVLVEVPFEEVSSRWLISVIDTIADKSPHPVERMGACVVTTFFGVEKWAATDRLTRPGRRRVRFQGQPWFDWGLQSAVLDPGMDHHRNLIKRVEAQLEGVQWVWPIWRVLLKRYLSSGDGTLSQLSQVHSRCLTKEILEGLRA